MPQKIRLILQLQFLYMIAIIGTPSKELRTIQKTNGHRPVIGRISVILFSDEFINGICSFPYGFVRDDK